jgi:23S rRNA pseudouridine1911/1915/1917 synthase
MSGAGVFVVEQSLPLERLDVFLRRRLPELSRVAIQRLLAEGHILVNNKNVKPTHHPRAGETISIEIPVALPALAQPEDMPLHVLFEDQDMIVLNKPAGVVVHPAPGHAGHTLVNALLHHCGAQLSGIGGVARPGIVHRLDKDTSGCLVAAKNDAAHLQLSEAFAQRAVVKIYQAVVCGQMTRSAGRIEAAISRHPTQRKKMAVATQKGRDARTTYRALARGPDATWLEVHLHTGRTHQIRVHLAHVGFPVAGDLVYGRRANARLRELSAYIPPRQLLHAWRLELLHPRTQQPLAFEAPLPKDFAIALDSLGLKP